ncbi:hypothetical protein G6F57_002654 [Rhizopus arrhizus]|nr:hypothetical protein G6F30_000556 [Rhizopus arrhizus]KAG1418957.1 hypothetical protein G6F58_004839 [Rhizopus delemar]KAG0989156.1 hypothetical protein G6F29_001204 [Rhizopus arrhizus]KAG0996915.1 hypothetical protein G6F28_003395 [Rhizopus arrhizus]KAG1010941.1 hypothetical protein G6F27_004194 [Rhizopus arrhizus]
MDNLLNDICHNDFDFPSFTFFEDQEFYATLSMNQEQNDDNLLKRNYATFIKDDSFDDNQSSGSKSPRTKRSGRKIMINDDEDEEKKRRKEQNRAAQRAFRERKERHVKELERRFRQFQDKHTMSIQQLIQENQYLRSVICRLEVENCVLKGTPVDSIEDVTKALENARSTLPLPPPPSLANFQLSVKPPLPPLQIRPSPMENIHQACENQKTVEAQSTARKNPSDEKPEISESRKKSTIESKGKSSAESTDRDFTFSIMTPDSLRTSSQEAGRNQHFPAVLLYSDHGHPATILRKNRLKKQNELEANELVANELVADKVVADKVVASEVVASEIVSDKVQKVVQETIQDESQRKEPDETDKVNEIQDFDEFLKPFLATHDDISTHGTISRATATNTTPAAPVSERKSNERRQQTSSKIWQRVSEHASNPKFSVDQLLNAVKKSTLLTNERLVLDEWDMEQMLQDF